MNVATLHGPGRPSGLHGKRRTVALSHALPARGNCLRAQRSLHSLVAHATGGQPDTFGQPVAETRDPQESRVATSYSATVSSDADASTRYMAYAQYALAYMRTVNRNWANIMANPAELGTSLFFVLGVILVNYGVESTLDYYLGDSPLGSIGCILVGAGVVTYLKLKRIPVARTLLSGFWN